MAKSNDPGKFIRRELTRLGAVKAGIDPAAVRVMKPQSAERAFSREGWVFELKYDGYRVLAAGGNGEARLFYKSGRDATAIFPELARDLAALPLPGLVIDGEAVVLGDEGRPDFQRLQKRGLLTRAADAAQAAASAPVTLFAFDLLACEGFDLRALPLSARKAMLRHVLGEAGHGWLRRSEEVPERGEDLYAAVVEMGLEGIVAKRADSLYRAGYSADWLKVRADRSSDFAVVGFEPVARAQTGVRNLHLAARLREGRLAYAGTVGSGLTGAQSRDLREILEALRRAEPAVAVPAAARNALWVEPEIVVEVRYKDWTADGNLRHPVFLRVRDDKKAEECFRPGEEEETAPPAPAASPASAFSNLGKVYWPGDGITKGDLIGYYRAVSRWMLPYLRDRGVVLDRYPDGIAGKSFFQKDLGSSGAIVCGREEELLALVNLGAIPFHIESSRNASPDRPDWCILDLDPKSAPFPHVVEIALALRDLCAEIEIPSYPKTSGGSGLHVLLPLGGGFPHEQARQLAELLAQLLVRRLPRLATTARSVAARGGRVYVDALQNGRGKLLAAPYAVRPRPGAPVSTPLDWSEVHPRLDVGAYNLRTVPRRLWELGDDPLRPLRSDVPDLARTLDLLAALL